MDNYFGGETAFPGRVGEIILRLPPLYLMDRILASESSFFFGIKNKQQINPQNDFSEPDASFSDPSLSSPGVNIHSPPQDFGYTEQETQDMIRETANSLMNETSTSAVYAAYEGLYRRLYGDPALAVIPYFTYLGVCIAVYLSSFFILLLSPRQLVLFYTYFVAFACLPLSLASHLLMIQSLGNPEAQTDDPQDQGYLTALFAEYLSKDTRAVAVNYFCQSVFGLVMGSVFGYHSSDQSTHIKLISLSILSPNFFAILGFPPDTVGLAAVCSLVLPLILVLKTAVGAVYTSVTVALQMYLSKREFIANFGLHTFLESEWVRLRVPTLLRTFWLSRLSLHLAIEIFKVFTSTDEGNATGQTPPPSSSGNGSMSMNLGNLDGPFEMYAALWNHTLIIGKELASRGAETIIAVLGMTSVLSSICHYVGAFFHFILTAGDADGGANDGGSEEERSMAAVSAVIFLVLSLQTGITSLEPEKRFSRLCKNLCLLVTALFHFIHNIVSPVLMSLSASHNFNGRKHARALGICLFLVLTPATLMSCLWTYFPVGTWLLAVFTFCIEVIVKVAVTICVYGLFLYDHYFKSGTWESLDDAVYYVKAVGNSVEFCFAVFLFFNGGWILLFESGGTIRALMMVIHAYCNIWCEARQGWQTFMKRRTAVAKINGLPDATAEELQDHNDVCAICYQDMTSAKVTTCRHFFHGVCLRKWLYVQDTCPLCHAALCQQQVHSKPRNPEDNVEPELAGALAAAPRGHLEDENNQRAFNDQGDQHLLEEAFEQRQNQRDRLEVERLLAEGEMIDNDDRSISSSSSEDDDDEGQAEAAAAIVRGEGPSLSSAAAASSSSTSSVHRPSQGSVPHSARTNVLRSSLQVKNGQQNNSSSSSGRSNIGRNSGGSSSSSNSEDDRMTDDIIYDSMEEFANDDEREDAESEATSEESCGTEDEHSEDIIPQE